ncbi:phosphodiester glycosidase family protein [Actinophytocola algeriensis]|uniref:Exopolysaccharide biosynthesis protein/predicted phosphodiesterase n=1 Tax=Actinophytocola algeriensis TaxID=1768010 RepID=A0A7W7Q6T3_9PSEU|nr:phosphodiester glycosidase family protein [Actinophytocola algeriensis]MBB4907923.1 exopolysaccharide biosynthesis protein/predicted phosphodiesterase [Actinophytocola algeriensis]MBE1479953.1 exopolysaccharide biosynthesis protein/predicted phosphodiesterase [Actinophytocola algeriensis]
MSKRLLSLLAAAASAVALAAPAAADTDAATSDAAAFPGDDFLASARQAKAAPEDRIETASRTRPVAPGVTLRSFDRYGPDAYTGAPTWLQGDSLTVDLTKGTTVDYLFPGQVAKGEPLSATANRAGAVAAVNGDFFDINNSNAALGVGIKDGELIQSPDSEPTWRQSSAIFTERGVGDIGEVFFEGTITTPDGDLGLDGVNKPTLRAGGIEAFTPLWGTYCRCRATQGATAVAEVEVRDNTVVAVRDAAGEGAIPAGTMILVGRDAAAATLTQLEPGDPVSIDYRARTADDQKIHAAINGRQLLVVDGVAQKASQGNNTPAAPRTALGFSRDGRKMFLLSADGRQPAFADGLGLDELAGMMVELGAWSAVNLDGGGSTTIVVREPGATTAQLENRPSDGAERNVPNGLGLFAPEGSGRLKAFWVETKLDPTRASGASTVAPSHPERVLSGLSRTLTAAGYDETYGPAAGDPRWRTDNGTVRDGVFTGRRPGAATVVAQDRGARGETTLTVIGEVARTAPTKEQIALSNPDETTTFGVLGFDDDGTSAPVEPRDVTLTYDRNLLDITPNADGQYTVQAEQPTGSALVTVDVRGKKSVLPVTVGLTEVSVADFTDTAGWKFLGERATGAVAPATGHDGQGLRLTYDFTQSTGTRTGGAVAPPGLVLPGQPKAIRLWVNSTGKGEWASMQVWDGNGTLLPAFRAGYLTHTGWRQLEFQVPAGTTYPLTLRRFYAAETVASNSYHGDLVIDGITALVPPTLDVPPQPVVEDPVIHSTAGGDWRFAVMSDAQFVARDPDSDIVRNARRTLREIKAAKPDFLIINGDLVDEASAADFALARKILDEELGGTLPFHYVPGNHERGNNSLDNFRAVFGDTQQVIDHKGTRFITMDTSGINLRASDWTQLGRLRTELQKAATDRRVKSVVLVEHVPPRDPTPARASELSDRKEAATIESWLSAFQDRTGKGTAFIGAHVGTFHASHVDGVPYFVNGNSGKNPSTLPSEGGFTGWSLWGVDDRGAPGDWLAAEVRPHVDTLTVDAPDSLPVGRSTVVTASITQADRTVPVAYPVSARWSASPNVHIGPQRDAKRYHTANFDPATGELTALRPSTITLAVTVNGATQRQTLDLIATRTATG